MQRAEFRRSLRHIGSQIRKPRFRAFDRARIERPFACFRGETRRVDAGAMAEHGMLDHQGRDGSSPADRVGRTGYPWRSVGENIAMGQTSAQQVVRDLFGIYAERPSEMKHRFAYRAVAAQEAAPDPGGMPHARIVADFIAGMTDRYAITRYREVVGPVDLPEGF